MHTFIHYRETLTQGYPEDRTTHPKGVRGHSRTSRRNNHSLKEDEGTPSWEISVGEVFSTHTESPWLQVHCSQEPSLGISVRCLFYSLVRSELWLLMVSGLEVSLRQGTSLVRTLPANWGVPPISFPPQGRSMWLGSQNPSRGMVVSTGPRVFTRSLPRQSTRTVKVRAWK